MEELSISKTQTGGYPRCPVASESAYPTYARDRYAADFACAQYGSPLDIVRVIQSSAIKFDVCIFEGSWAHISFAPKIRRAVRVKKFDQFGVTVTTPFQSETLDDSLYAPKTFSGDLQDTTGSSRSPVLKH